MKQAMLPACLLLVLLAFGIPCHGQISIERAEFSRMEGFIDSLLTASSPGFGAPNEGPDQVWDYSNLQSIGLITQPFIPAAGDPDFPSALNYENNTLSFQAFSIPAKVYETLDNQGWYLPGWTITDVTYPIATITGGANDSLRFVGGPVFFDGRHDQVKFPMSYGDDWAQSRIEVTNFRLSVAAFGLNKTPGSLKRENYQHRQVVGYGKLTIPDYSGAAGTPMDVLLLKVTHSAKDSVFLGGAPAPPALMAAFGLSQGATAADSFYVFYRENFYDTVLNINYTGSNEFTAYYRPQGMNVLSASRTPASMVTSAFPNPIVAGQPFTVETEMPLAEGTFNLSSLQGSLVYESPFMVQSSNQLQVTIPPLMLEGVYFYQITDKFGAPVGGGKIIVK